MLLRATSRALLHRVATGQVHGRAPSMTSAVVRDGAPVWSHAIETTTDTPYRIGSLTKTFVAVLVMRLRDEGLPDPDNRPRRSTSTIDLDDPLDNHVGGTERRRVA